MSELDILGVLSGTDKSSSFSYAWDYLRHYEELFSRWRDRAFNLIEIGVFQGSSLEVWSRWFENAQIIGIDINPACKRFEGNRVAVRIGSQEDPGFLQTVAFEFPPTIVIDDGSHLTHHMIASFETLFPALLPGGYYIFEDMAFHFEDSPRQHHGAKAQQGLSDTPMFDYLNKFVRAKSAGLRAPKDSWGFARYAFENIDSITVASGFIAVRKAAARHIEQDVIHFERELSTATSDRAAKSQRYAEYLFRNNHLADRAAALLSEVVAAEPRNEPALNMLIQLHLRSGLLDHAAAAAHKLARLNESAEAGWERLVFIERRRARPDLEAVALHRLIALNPQKAEHHARLSEVSEATGDLQTALTAARRAGELEPANAKFRNRVAALQRR